MQVSIIDYGLKDFLRNDDGDVIILDIGDIEEAEEWLLDNSNTTDWTNNGTYYWVWEE